MRLVSIIGAIVAVLAIWAVVYNSPAFSIKNVQVNGVEHLTNEEMAQLASIPSDTTLLRVDVDAVATRVKQSSWIESVKVDRVFPDTLEINVTERKVLAIAEMPNDSGTATKSWAIAEDRIWLMPIPDASSEAAQTTSAKIYEDADSAVHIVDLPYGTQAEIGQECSDEVVSNALDILQEMTTELSGQVIKVSAASIAETSLFLESGVEIAFGSAEDIRDKERTILKIMEDNPDGIAYINVRMVENPTWRSL
ncbi:MAG: FtsQ-type POTRA domain-containing protein [Eggerthellaceae bacterium]|nr:FtsQ-type POTRA domain-containing protein [Eggerthellaceae bacterium]